MKTKDSVKKNIDGEIFMNILEIKNISKSYNQRDIFKNLSLKAEEGQIISIIGPSGIGKSTLLKCINGLEKVDSGDIIICNQSIVEGYKNSKIFKQININTGIVFQEFNLFPHLSVVQNIMLPLTCVLNKSKEEAENQAISLLEQVKLEKRKDAYPFQLSGGEKQRVAIARTLAINPKLICFDEPTSALDVDLVEEVIGIIRDLSKEKKAILIVTHDLKFAEEISDVIVDFKIFTKMNITDKI